MPQPLGSGSHLRAGTSEVRQVLIIHEQVTVGGGLGPGRLHRCGLLGTGIAGRARSADGGWEQCSSRQALQGSVGSDTGPPCRVPLQSEPRGDPLLLPLLYGHRPRQHWGCPPDLLLLPRPLQLGTLNRGRQGGRCSSGTSSLTGPGSTCGHLPLPPAAGAQLTHGV